MSFSKHTYVDADAFVALNNPKDASHERAKKCLEYIQNNDISLATSQLVILEVATVLPLRLKNKTKKVIQQMVQDILKSNMVIFELNPELFTEAMNLYSKQTSKNIGAFDTYHMAVMKRYSIKTIFSFDRCYKKNGFSLIIDLI